MDIENLSKGAVPDQVDPRDYKIESLGAAALPPVDWSVPFMVPDVTAEDQENSDACVAYASSYYHDRIHRADYSRRDLFARIALGYGAYIRDGVKAIVEAGQATRDEVPDPPHPTAQNMRDKTGITADKEKSHQELNYFILPKNIDAVASGIKQYQGVIFGVVGSNPGWHDLTNPRPPLAGETTWGHALYGRGYHMHDAQKCIIAKPSWSGVTEHHIKEDYFANPQAMENFIFNPWSLIGKEQQMNTYVRSLNLDGEVGYFVPLNDENAGELELLAAIFNKPPLVPKPDGTIDTELRAKKV